MAPTPNVRGRVLVLALDAAEPRLVEEGMAEGWLPHLRRLRDRGAYGRLRSTAEWLGASGWPTFCTGLGPEHHGFYNGQQWRAEKSWVYRCTPRWLPVEPFWRGWGPDGPRVIALDMPNTYEPRPFNGVEVSGWVAHDRIASRSSHPPGLIDWVEREFGALPLGPEPYTLETWAELMDLRERLLTITDMVRRAGLELMERERWDLCLIAFGAPHRGGHRLWDDTGLAETDRPDAAATLMQALRDVYASCDAAIGTLVERAGPDTNVLALSPLGMGPNISRCDVLDEMLRRILDASGGEAEAATPPRPGRTEGGPLQRMRERVPERYRSLVKDNLPFTWQEWLTRFWRRRQVDWSSTRALTAEPELHGYVRINLKGRERYGVVEPGEEFDCLCDEIADGLHTFADADTGEPIVVEVARADRVYPAGPQHSRIPDLLVRWSETPAAAHRALQSQRYGTIAWPTPGRNPTGRAGNHREEGFLVARGRGFAPGSDITGAHILDLAPTIYDLLGMAAPAHMQGHSLIAREAAAVHTAPPIGR